MPSQAIAETQRMPVGFLEDVIAVRRYVDAYHANKRDPKSYDTSVMRTLAMQIEAECAAEALNGANA